MATKRVRVTSESGLPPRLSIDGTAIPVHSDAGLSSWYFDIDDAFLGGGGGGAIFADAPLGGDGSSGDHLALALNPAGLRVSGIDELELTIAGDGGIETVANDLAIKLDPAGVASLSSSGLLVPASSGGLYTIDNLEAFNDAYGPDLGYDVEFNRAGNPTTLPAGWAAINGNSGTYLERVGKGSWSMASGLNSISNVTFIGRNAPVESSWTCIAKVFNKSFISFAPCMSTGLMLTDGTIGYGIIWNSNPLVLIAIWTDIASVYGSNPGTADVTAAESGICYWKIVKHSANSYDFAFSYDGTYWITPVVGDGLDVGAVLTPTKLGFVCRQASGPQQCIMEWFRVRA